MILDLIRTIPDYPKPGIMFRDITPVLKDPAGFRWTIDALALRYKDLRIAKVAGIEARGFILGAPLALALSAGFVPIRKKGKLPGKVISTGYKLEYGTDVIELHEDAIVPGERVLLVDDLIATGGTATAGAALVQQLKGTLVECCFAIDLPDLGGSSKLRALGLSVFSLCQFEGE